MPLFLFPTMHGAKELGLSLKEYFSKAEYVIEGELRLREKYRNDCVSGFLYAAIEVEAMGGEVIYREDGPPNSGRPILQKPEQIKHLEPPKIEDAPCLTKVLDTIQGLKAKADDVPIIGVAISPFSLPVMQMGFGPYIELMYEQPDLFERLMKINETFCVSWANAQLAAGATAICYFDPVSSPTITPRKMFLKTGFEVAQRTIAKIKGPTATHLASGRCLPIVDDLARTGTAIVGVSVEEDLSQVKEACRGKLTVLGNLNGIEMCRWSPEQAQTEVKRAIASAAAGGGFILSDNHGEIPFQVPDEVLLAISEAVHTWGRYPLNWMEADG